MYIVKAKGIKKGKCMQKTTNIIYNNELCNYSIEDIFDIKKYNQLTAVTYSASPKFINKYLIGFNNINMVVGIPEERVQAATNDELLKQTLKSSFRSTLANESLKFLNELDISMKKQVINKKFQVQVPIAGNVIHSKFYLLSNDKTSNTRIILGSANLSSQAFEQQYNQFEEILIYDNSPLFDIYQQHYFYDLEPILTDYISKNTFQMIQNHLNDGSSRLLEQDELVSATIFTSDDIANIQTNDLSEKVQQLRNGMKIGIIPENTGELVNQIKNEKVVGTNEFEKNQIEQSTSDQVFNLISNIISTNKGTHRLVTKETAKKKVSKVLSVKLHQPINKNVNIKRPLLALSTSNIDVDNNQSGLFVKDILNKNKLLPFGKRSSTDSIKNSLHVIDQLIENYHKFAIDYSDEYGQRIYEAILFAFTSPFISIVRSKIGRSDDEEIRDIPQILFIGGEANSGKSSLLRVLSKMVNTSSTPRDFVSYDLIYQDDYQKGANTVKILKNWLSEENVTPLLVDELPNDFFTNDKRGEELIMNLNNNVAVQHLCYPAMIGTTNNEDYTLGSRARRRSYYLKHDAVFDDDYKEASLQAYHEIINQTDNKLFQDFVLRFAAKIDNDTTNWNVYQNGKKNDFLAVTRDVFKEYYQEIGEPLPKYFPLDRYDDANESGQEKWRKLFDYDRENFVYNNDTDRLLYSISKLDENINRYGTKPSIEYVNALSSKVKASSDNSIDQELKGNEFFKWIGEDNPFIKKSLLSKLFQK